MKTRMKRLKLKDVKPNPFRDIENYTLDPEKVESLRASIGSTGFWPGILIREHEGENQLLFGHHRLEAARQELGGDYEHDFIVRDNVDDVTAIRMMSDENADSWSMGPQHALLCVKQARNYLENADKNGTVSTIVETVFSGDVNDYKVAKAKGFGEDAVLALLGGAFTKRAVRDALAVLNAKHVDPRVAGKFTNLSQARTFAKMVESPDGAVAGLQDPERQREFVDQTLKDLQPQGNSVDPKRKNAPSKVPLAERLTAQAIETRVQKTADAVRGTIAPTQINAATKLAASFKDAESRCYSAGGSLKRLQKDLAVLPGTANPTGLPEASTFLEAVMGLQADLDETIRALNPQKLKEIN